jgi:hypothetical protein
MERAAVMLIAAVTVRKRHEGEGGHLYPPSRQISPVRYSSELT